MYMMTNYLYCELLNYILFNIIYFDLKFQHRSMQTFDSTYSISDLYSQRTCKFDLRIHTVE